MENPIALPLDAAGIQKLLPHRYPFLLVDRVLEIVPDKHILAYKNITQNEPFFTGHFPHRPGMPGVLMLEARIDGSVEGAKVRLNIPIRGFPEKPDGKKIRQSWPAARAVLKAADWELIALHMRAGLEDAGATAMFAGGIREVAADRQRLKAGDFDLRCHCCTPVKSPREGGL